MARHPVTGFRGPGRRGDFCPQVTLEGLRVFARLPEPWYANELPSADELLAVGRVSLRAWRERGPLQSSSDSDQDAGTGPGQSPGLVGGGGAGHQCGSLQTWTPPNTAVALTLSSGASAGTTALLPVLSAYPPKIGRPPSWIRQALGTTIWTPPNMANASTVAARWRCDPRRSRVAPPKIADTSWWVSSS